MRLMRDAVPSSVDVPSSGRLMTGRLVVQFLGGLTDPFMHFHMYDWMSNDIARSVNAFPRVEMLSRCCRCSDSRGHCSCLFCLRSKSHRPPHHRHVVCHLRESAEELFTEPINHCSPEASPSSLSHCLIQFQRSPTS